MGRLVVFNCMSLDGYVSGPDNNVMLLPLDESFDRYCAERLRESEFLLLGRTTYDMFRGFWPSVAADPNASASQREISQLDNAIRKVVVSDRIAEHDTDPWRETTTIVRRDEAHQRIADLKQDGDIVVFGSITLWNDLLAAGLVDELHLMVGPVILGGGTPAFSNAMDETARLLDVHPQEGSQNVLLRYAVDRF